MGFFTELRRQARERGGADAVVSDGASISHAALLNRVEAGAEVLLAQGIDGRSTVGVTIANEVEHLIASLALLVVGARHVTLATHDSEPLRDAVARRVRVTHRLVRGEAPDLPDGTYIQWRPDNATNSDVALRLPGGTGTVYLKTSGTTGGMNIVAFVEEQLAEQSQRHAEYAHERLLRLASIEHNNSKRHRLYCAYAGGTNVFRPIGDVDIVAFCAAHNVSCLDISRMHASDLAARGNNAGLAGVKLRTGGSAIPIDVRRDIERQVTPLLFVRYAATECGAIAMALPGQHDEDESVGRPLPGVELEIVDANGSPVPAGATGHVRLRAGGMATGYFESPDDSASRFRDGWFWPGDIGRLRSDGSLVVSGRKDDMMILNGLNIFPVEIERVLERHPAVSVAAALPLASVVHGQIPVAAVELRKGHAATPAELSAYAREHLALRAPRRILIMDALPRNSQGKIMRREIALAFRPERKSQ